MTSTTIPAALAQLEGFLAQDPNNDSLRAEAFQTALNLGARERAEAHLQAGLASGINPLAWRLHQAHWLMAAHDWPAACDVLTALQREPGAPPELVACALQDQAQIALRQGDAELGLSLLKPLMPDADSGPAPDQPLQALWLRLMHRTEKLDEAVELAKRWAKAGALGVDAAGVASLMALDAGDMALSQAWSEAAMAHQPNQMEALVARGSIALAEQAPQRTKELLKVALQQNPNDGRTLSAWAFAEMLGGELSQARQTFRLALENMPEHIGTWHGLGWAALMQDDLSAARAAFDQALALDRNFAESHGGLAVVLARGGDRAGAEASINVAMRLDRTCMSAHYAQAVLDGTAQDAQALQNLAARLMAAKRAQERRG
jgi:Tfp pilus assembly protein PilF